jgi:tetratricopeptide (TPR) repeat protein
VTLYEMLTGQLPFGGRNTPLGKVMDLIRSADYVPPSHVKPDLPPQLDTIIGRALTRSPHDRYKSAEEMRQALIAFRQKKGSSRIDKDLEAIRGLLSTVEPSPEMEPKLKELMRKNPDEPRIYQYLGEYYNRCQRYGEAIDMFNAGIARNPDYALLYWDLALALQRKGQKREARKNLEQAVTLGLDPSLQRHATMLLQVLGK